MSRPQAGDSSSSSASSSSSKASGRGSARSPSWAIKIFGAFTGASLAIGLAAIALAERRRLAQFAVVGGGLGVILDASVFAYLGVVLAVVAAGLRGRRAGTLTTRRAAALAGIVLVVGGGVFGLRGYDVANFLSFPRRQAGHDLEHRGRADRLAANDARLHRTADLGGPSAARSRLRPVGRPLPALSRRGKRKFPNQPAQAYPSPTHPWGVQNFWIQLLADVGIVGFILGVATFITGLAVALRAPRSSLFTGLVATGWILVAAGTWNAVGIIAGIPLEAVTWLGLGLAVASQEIS